MTTFFYSQHNPSRLLENHQETWIGFADLLKEYEVSLRELGIDPMANLDFVDHMRFANKAAKAIGLDYEYNYEADDA